jgi:hypothetical protein
VSRECPPSEVTHRDKLAVPTCQAIRAVPPSALDPKSLDTPCAFVSRREGRILVVLSGADRNPICNLEAEFYPSHSHRLALVYLVVPPSRSGVSVGVSSFSRSGCHDLIDSS